MNDTGDPTIEVGCEDEGERLDLFVTRTLDSATRAEVQRLITLPDDTEGGVLLNGRRARPSRRLKVGDSITVSRPTPVSSTVVAEAIPIRVVYEDRDLLVIDKARGMVTHPAPGSEHGTLVNAVLAHSDDLSGIGGEIRPGIVHRLDKDTGGLIVVAKTDAAHRALQEQIQSREAKRRYLAIVWGVPTFATATIDAPIGRHPTDRKRMAVINDPRYASRSAQTDIEARTRYGAQFALIEAALRTGRTHQIRVHCSYIRHPIVGDPVYGGSRRLPAATLSSPARKEIELAIEDLNGQALHAYSLSFTHPTTRERLDFKSELPLEMKRLLQLLDAAYTPS